jgi:Flp pilus assembly pilin Flp
VQVPRDPTRSIARFLIDEGGPTAVEYSVMLAMVLAVVIMAVSSFGTAQDNYWGRIDSAMRDHGIK